MRKSFVLAFVLTIGLASGSFAAVPALEKQVIRDYLQAQFNANDVTWMQFAAMSPAQQRQVLAPGRQFAASREERGSIVPMHASVPATVVLKQDSTVTQTMLEQYGVSLPESLQTQLSSLGGVRYVLIGSNLLLLSADNRIEGVVPML
jgi:hypothetical protein